MRDPWMDPATRMLLAAAQRQAQAKKLAKTAIAAPAQGDQQHLRDMFWRDQRELN